MSHYIFRSLLHLLVLSGLALVSASPAASAVSLPAAVLQINQHSPHISASDPQADSPIASADIPDVTLENVEIAGSLGGSVEAIAIVEPYAFIGMGWNLLALDVSDSQEPSLVGVLPLGDTPRDIVLVGNQAFVAAGAAGMRVVDISDPAHLVEIGAFTSAEGFPGCVAKSISVKGDYAYLAYHVTTWYGDLVILDISDPTQPEYIGRYTSPGKYEDVVVAGDYAYVADYDIGLRVFDVSNPAFPAEVGRYTGGYYAHRLELAGKQAYLMAETALYRLDISNPAAPQLELTYPLDLYETAYALAVVEPLVWLATAPEFNGARLIGLDFSDPGAPVRVAQFDFPSEVKIWHSPVPRRLALAGDTACLGTSGAGVRLLDLGDLGDIQPLGSYAEPGMFVDLVNYGGFTYAVSGGDGGLWVLAPWQDGSLRPVALVDIRPAYSVALSGHFAFVGASTAGLYVVDIADPLQPQVVAHYDPLWGASILAVYDHYLYAIDNQWGFAVLDISDPLNPLELSITEFVYWNIFQATVVGRALYLEEGWAHNWLIYDLADAEHPQQIGLLEGDSSPSIVSADRAYFSGYSHGFQIFDLSDPFQPALLGAYNYGGANDHTILAGLGSDVAYLSDGWRGLAVLDISDPASMAFVGQVDYSNSDSSVYNVAYGLQAGDLFYHNVYQWYGPWSWNQYLIVAYRFTGLAIAGQVRQTNGLPFAGATLAISSTLTNTLTTSGADGRFAFVHLERTVYDLAPSLPGYAFEPPSRTLTLPPNGYHQDFTILPLPASASVLTGTAATLTFTDTQGLPTALAIPPGAVTQTLTLTLTPFVPADGVGPNAFFGGHAFALSVSPGVPGFTFQLPLTITIAYSQADIRVASAEDQLTLYWWDAASGAWLEAAQACDPPVAYHRDLEGNALGLPLCRAGKYALFGPTNAMLLPLLK